jgi:pimeloyl-ACP methyl ester carboxylesterase
LRDFATPAQIRVFRRRRNRSSQTDAQIGPAMRITLDATMFDVLDEGRGTAVVLLHAFPLAKEEWDPQAAALASRARVIRPDLRGLGRSDVTAGPVLMESLASDVASLLDAFEIERAVIVGHSLGSYVAFAFLRLFAERVSGLGIVSGRPDADDAAGVRRRLDLADATEHDGMQPLIDFYLPRLFAAEVYAERPTLVEDVRSMCGRTDPRGAAAVMRGMALRVAADDLLAEIAVPAVVVAGVRDGLIPIETQRALAAAIPGAVIEEIDAGHMATLEAPRAVTAALERLVTAAERG